MAKAAARVRRKSAVRKYPQLLSLTPLGRELLAAIIEYQAHCWLGPETGNLSEELSADPIYETAHTRIYERLSANVRKLTAKVLAAPLSIKSLADRALVAHQWAEHDIADYMPNKRRTRDDKFSDEGALLAAVVALSDLPWVLDCNNWSDKGPPDAKERIERMLGNHRPARRALSSGEMRRIADGPLARSLEDLAGAALSLWGPRICRPTALTCSAP